MSETFRFGLIVLPVAFIALSPFFLMACEGKRGNNPTFDESTDTLGSDEFVTVEVLPQLVLKVEPIYPPAALAARIEGIVWVRLLIDTSGNVVTVIVAKESSATGWGFEESALDAARWCKFTPAIQQGRPIALWVTFPFEFKLKK